jgi:NADH (or F420H2) dehydrogenase, subunit C|tara:strand:+ start:185 stop:793 length:609 start_codon:yes stop_codon:yes gene_type:complete
MITSIKDLEKTINSALATSIKKSEIKLDQLFIEINDEDLISTILFLKTNNKCRFKQLIDITATDYPDREKRFRVVYLLLSHENNLRIIIYFNIDEKKSVASITKIFPSANWMEREVFDMYGISFKDHPNLKRILTDYGFKGFPLRKDFPLTGHNEVRYSESKKKVIYENVKLDQDYRNFEFDSPWEGTNYIDQQSKENDKEK